MEPEVPFLRVIEEKVVKVDFFSISEMVLPMPNTKILDHFYRSYIPTRVE